MADQATMTRFNGSAANSAATQSNSGSNRPSAGSPLDSNTAGVVSSVTGFGEDLLTLAELQARLTAIELRQNLESAKNAGALILVGTSLAIASLPVLMVGFAELLVSELGIRRGYALLSTGMAAVVIAGVCVAVARNWLRANPLGFPVAAEEFGRNLNWVRTILRHSGRWPLHR
jgi:Putative Actinobacterial Holin-X, holin superfamily III